MKKFYYRAKKGPEKIVQGEMDAATKEQAIEQLTQQGLSPLDLREKSPERKSAGWFSFLAKRAPNPGETADFLDQLADLTRAGLPLLKALDLVAAQPRREAWEPILTDLRASVRGGTSFSEAMEKFPAVFGGFIVSMTRSGEQSGTFDTALEETVLSLERGRDLKGKVRQALIYPGIITGFGLLTVILLAVLVIPRIEELYADFGGTLPLFTRLVLASSRLLVSFGWLLVLLPLAFAVFLRSKGPEAKAVWLSVARKIPWVGRFAFLEDRIYFTRTLGLLLKNGIPAVEALGIAQEVVQEPRFRSHMVEAREAVRQGTSLARALERTERFPGFVLNFIQTGEETGTLDQALEKISAFYEKEIDRRIKLFGTLIEPLLILLVGVLVGVIVVSLLLPIFEISTLIR